MIDGEFPVKINGVPYHLDHASESEAYVQRDEPLRPQNSALALSSDEATFQTRPDVLIWDWTDWSGGEGQYRYSNQAANRYWYGYNLDPFTVPGTLTPGWGNPDWDGTTYTADSVDYGYFSGIVKDAGPIFVVETDNPVANTLHVYEIDDTYDDATDLDTLSLGAVNPIRAVTGIDNFAFIYTSDDDLYRWDADAASFDHIVVGGTYSYLNGGNSEMCVVGNSLLLMDGQLGIYEWSVDDPDGGGVSSTAPTELWTTDVTGRGVSTTDRKGLLVAGEDAAYFTFSTHTGSTIIKIEPTTAAAAGTAYVWKRFPGLYISSLSYINGFLYFFAHSSSTDNDAENSIMYIQPDGTVGTLGVMRQDIPHSPHDLGGDNIRPNALGGGLATTFDSIFFITNDPRDVNWLALWQINTITGGYAHIGTISTADTGTASPRSLVVYRNRALAFVDEGEDLSDQVLIWAKNEYYNQAAHTTTPKAQAVSPLQTFNLTGSKLLSSIKVQLAELPADWEVEVQYMLDESGTWVSAGTVTTTGTTSQTFQVSTTSTSVEFDSIRLRILFEYTGAASANPTTAPTVLSVSTAVQVTEKVKVWNLRLSVADDNTGEASVPTTTVSGAERVNNLEAIGQGSVEFLDGMVSRDPNTYNTHAVVVDSMSIVLDRPQEGYADVVLREVQGDT